MVAGSSAIFPPAVHKGRFVTKRSGGAVWAGETQVCVGAVSTGVPFEGAVYVLGRLGDFTLSGAFRLTGSTQPAVLKYRPAASGYESAHLHSGGDKADMVIELGFAIALIGLIIAGIVVLYRFSRRNKPD